MSERPNESLPLEADARSPAHAVTRYDVEALGLRLRQIRREQGLTINQLAKRSGVPGSTISKLETGQLKPSLVHAISLSESLGTNLGFLVARFRGQPELRSIVSRDERDEINYPEMGLSLQDLSANFVPGLLETRLGQLQQGAHSGTEPMRHAGEEFCYVLDGRIRYTIDGTVYELGRGDSIHFKSELPHRWENASRGPTRVLWTFSDGLSF